MALTQSVRFPGWEEEVVPALRKRLESESRTLSHRMSAISVSSSVEDLPATFAKPASIRTTHNDYRQPGSSSQSPGPGYHSVSVDHPTTPSTSTRANGVQSARRPVATSFHRSRTYSQPYAMVNMNGSARPRPNAGKSGNNASSTPLRSPRPGDPKPTRIPKVSRTSNTPSSPPPLPSLNGNAAGSGVGYFPSTTNPSSTPMQTRTSSDTRSQNLPTLNSSSQVNLGPIQPHRIINEPAPFNSAASSNSSIYNTYDIDGFSSRPSRDSMDSEERPFEHWYRGEVSRNGGVGELRVGKRQEMLEIANYGHAISNKRKAIASRKAALSALEDNSRRVRKRADSIAGITRRDRGSLYLDEERAAQVGLVMDEDPLTDVEWEGSDIGSISTHNHHHHHHRRFSNHNADPDFIPGVGDVTTSTSYTDTPMTSYEDARSHTPTQTARTTPTPRSKSRQDSSSSRIPTISSDRKSSESRISTTTQHSSPKGQIPPQPQPVVDLTTMTTTTPKTPSPPPSTNPRSATPSSNKRGVSPGPNTVTATPTSPDGGGSLAKKARTAPTTPQKKGARPKPRSAMKKVVKEEDNRKSVAHYPTPGGDDFMDMADAIPSWTQPKPKEGNWDDVVLPVVARKKGLEDYYEKADGSPRPKKQDSAPIAPAPGTFGYDDTKYRRGRADGGDDDEIEMDEFGRPKGPDTTVEDNTAIPEEPEPQQEDEGASHAPASTAHDNIRVPVPSPISPPFSDYAPTTVQDLKYSGTSVGGGKQGVVVEQDEKGAGCCGCVVM